MTKQSLPYMNHYHNGVDLDIAVSGLLTTEV
jgi:hypothetical protein